jgi:predicted DNA-binding transcriptional regulator AlpA
MVDRQRIDLVGVAEVASMLGVKRQRIDQLSRTSRDFPRPVAVIAAGRIWLRADIEKWAEETGRQLYKG